MSSLGGISRNDSWVLENACILTSLPNLEARTHPMLQKLTERWNNTLHHPIHAAYIYLNLAISYSCGFRFDAEVMDEFLTCVQRMVASGQEHEEISKEMKIYRMPSGTFGFTMAIKNRTTKMPGKLQLTVCFNFQFSNFIIHSLHKL